MMERLRSEIEQECIAASLDDSMKSSSSTSLQAATPADEVFTESSDVYSGNDDSLMSSRDYGEINNSTVGDALSDFSADARGDVLVLDSESSDKKDVEVLSC